MVTATALNTQAQGSNFGITHIYPRGIATRVGFNAAPLEVEQAALEHPAVREAAAVGLADAIWGETVGLAVVAAGPIDAEELLGFCSTRLSAFKLPQHIAFVQELPRNAMGKVLRPRVRECFETEPAGTPRQTGSRT